MRLWEGYELVEEASWPGSGWSRSARYHASLGPPCLALSPPCPSQSHTGEALPPEMVARLYDGMRRVDLTRPAKGPSDRVSRDQFTVSMSCLLKGSSGEKSFMILKMISATDGPVKAREVQKVGRPEDHCSPPGGLGGTRGGIKPLVEASERCPPLGKAR